MKKLVITLVVLVGLLVAADFGAAAAAEYQVSQRVRSGLDLTADPSVRIHGFPFLTQALGGDYDNVDVSADRIQYGVLSLSVRATLHHVRVPLSALLGGSARTIRVDEADGTVLLAPADLANLLGVSDLRVEQLDAQRLEQLRAAAAADPTGSSGDAQALSQVDPDHAVQLTATAPVAGRRVDVAVVASLDVVDGKLKVTGRDLRVGSGGEQQSALPGSVQRALLRAFTTTIDPGRLPFGAVPTAVRAEGGSLAVSGTARDLVISGDGSR